MYLGHLIECGGCAANALVSSVSVLKPSVSETCCDSWPKAVYQLGDHLMDDVGGKSVYVRLVEHLTDVFLPFQSLQLLGPI